MSVEMFALDIETDTTVAGLDPRATQVTSMALWAPDWCDVIEGGTERSRLEKLAGILGALGPALMVDWNGGAFDLPMLSYRAREVGVDLGIQLVFDPSLEVKYQPLAGFDGAYRARVGRCRHADICHAYRRYAEARGVAWSLKPVARSLGLSPVEVDRAKMHELSREALVEYNLSDARVTYELAARLGDALAAYVDRIGSTKPGVS